MTDDFLPAWLEQAAVSHGVLACGVLPPGGSPAVKSTTRDIAKERVQEMVQTVGEMVSALQEDGIAPRQLCWTFEHNRLLCAARADGAVAIVLVKKKQEVVEVEMLLAQFLETTL